MKSQVTSHKSQAKKSILISILFFMFSLSIPGCAPQTKIYKKRFVIANTFVEVTSPYKEASGIVFSTMKNLEKTFNIYDASSDISRLNANAGIEPVKVSPYLIEIINLAKELHRLTGGAFDPSIGKTILFWKEKMTQDETGEFPEPEIIETILQTKGMDNIRVNKDESTAFIEKNGLILDLGGIAKGYMVDKAVLALKANDIDSALINAGGDMFCLGTKNKKPWHIGIRNPETIAGILDTLDIINEAVATSGDYEQFFIYRNKRYAHIINPYTGFPHTGQIRSVTVIAQNATTADGLSTAFFIMGKKGIQNFLQKNKSTLRILVVEEKDGKFQVHCFGPIH